MRMTHRNPFTPAGDTTRARQPSASRPTTVPGSAPARTSSLPAPTWAWIGALGVFLVLGSGCASSQARHRLEGVAKGWCETIRASQVIPVYPLTEDLAPGDVFLVQTPIASQARLYRQRGFLALDDRRTRLKDLDYGRVYFNGYWDWGQEFGATPHAPPSRPAPGTLNASNAVTLVFTNVTAPRAAFPSYTFEAQSSFGLSLALPIQGIPVALNFLQADRVSGSVAITDARTYAADEQQLYGALRAWAEEDDVQPVLDETVRRAGAHPIFLRVVSRVYLAGGVMVSVQRSGSGGGQARGGFNPPEVPPIVDAQGNVSTGYTNLLLALSNAAASPLSNLVNQAQAGGAVRFVAASSSGVGLAEAFDRLLAIGYLGFDVPVYPGGVLGAPLPTFQILDRTVSAPPPTRVGALTTEQSRVQINLQALNALVASEPQSAVRVMAAVARQLSSRPFAALPDQCAAALQAPVDQLPALAQTAYRTFDSATKDYVSAGGSTGLNYTRFDAAFTRAYDERDQE